MKLEIKMLFEDVDSYDRDEIIVEGYNRNEIMEAIKILLTKTGVKIGSRVHKWRVFKNNKE
jgi:hypothetical protein